MERSDRLGIGLIIKQLRLKRGLTQRELAKAAGMTESALRSYELGDRAPKDRHLEGIARALHVRPEVFTAGKVGTYLEAIHVLFSFEDLYNLRPITTDRGPAISVSKPTDRMLVTLREWAGMRERLDEGEISETEYIDWKNSYVPGSTIDISPLEG